MQTYSYDSPPGERRKVVCEVIDLRAPRYSPEADGSEPSTSSSTQVSETSPRPHSPSPSVLSVTPSTKENLIVSIDGREYSASSVYPFPFDLKSLEGVDPIHQSLKLGLRGEIFLGPVDEALQHDEQLPQKAVLDLGCGTGDWAIEMATRYPHCEVVGVDLIPIAKESLPPNFRMEVDDINLGLDHFHNSFDVVHAGAILAGIKDYFKMIDEIADALRPGGVITLVEHEYRSYDSEGRQIQPYPPGHPGHAWIPMFGQALFKTMRNIGVNPDGVLEILPYISRHPAFEDVGSTQILFPMHRWYPNPASESEYIANIVGEIHTRSMEEVSTSQMFSASGLSEDMIAELSEGAQREARTGTCPYKVANRVHFVWAKKKCEPWR